MECSIFGGLFNSIRNQMQKLALFGGPPVRQHNFPVWPRVRDHVQKQLIKTFTQEGWGIGSEAIARFDREFAEFHDSKYCLSTSSGTAALWVALKAAGVKAGDEVIVPAYTFIATASAVLMANAVPVFVDIDPLTLNMDPALIEAAVTARTKIILPVHVGGNPADMDKILSIAGKLKINVIEDAAQAHGSEWKGKKVGALGLGGIFSFQTSKNMTAGEGGAIVSNHEDFVNLCFSYYNCGRVKTGKWYEHKHLGGNFRLNAFAASILSAQLTDLPEEMEIRDRNRLKLDNALDDLEGITTVKKYAQTTRQSNHIYLTRYNSHELNQIPRDIFFKAMQAEGVYTYAGYKPLYREQLFMINIQEYPWLKNYNYADLNLSVTEKTADEEVVWLKQNHLLGSDSDTQDIINAFEKVTHYLKTKPELFLNKEVL